MEIPFTNYLISCNHSFHLKLCTLNEVRILRELCHCAVYSDGAFDCMSGQHLLQQIQQRMGNTRNFTINSQRYSLNTRMAATFLLAKSFHKGPMGFCVLMNFSAMCTAHNCTHKRQNSNASCNNSSKCMTGFRWT